MNPKRHHLLLNNSRMLDLLSSLSHKLQQESVIVASLPSCGKRTLFKSVEEMYAKLTGDHETLIVSFEIINSSVTINNLNTIISENLKIFLPGKEYHLISDAKVLIQILLKKGHRILIILDQFQKLIGTPETMEFLYSFRKLDHLNVRFLIGCDLSCVVNPDAYLAASTIACTNLTLLPYYSKEESDLIIDQFIYNLQLGKVKDYEDEIYNLCGGNLSLTKYVSKFINENGKIALNEEKLIRNETISLKLNQTIEGLEEAGLLKFGLINKKYLDLLKEIKFLDEKDNISSKLLDFYIHKLGNSSSDIILDDLTFQELSLFKLFDSQKNKIITLDEIAKVLWGNNVNLRFSVWSIYKSISNLNKKIAKYGYTISNKKGRGYLFSADK